MSRKRPRKARTVNDDENTILAGLPNELLFEVWDLLPPLERISVSQVCRKWRKMALSLPKLWSRLAFVLTWHHERCHCNRRLPASSSHNIYNPRRNTSNYNIFVDLLLRGKQLPLDVSFRASCRADPQDFLNCLRPHDTRITRLHFQKGEYLGLSFQSIGELLALRTLTAGFDDQDVEYSDLPPRITAGARFPALRQIHLGAAAKSRFFSWTRYQMPGIQELTLTPRESEMDYVLDALTSCTNLARLLLIMAEYVPAKQETTYTKNILRRCIDALARVPELCFTDIAAAHEKFLLTHFDDARFRSLTLDYMGRARRLGSSWYISLPCPCDALADPVQLTLKLRDSVYELAVVDSNGLRREIFLDRDTIRMAPGLWNCYLKKNTVASATVDAVAWEYFEDELPDPCAISELELVVLQSPSELQAVSLAHFKDLQNLRIGVVKSGMKFDLADVQKLVQSRDGVLPIISLPRNATFVEDVSEIAAIVTFQ